MSGSKRPVVIAGFDESRYTPFLPACRYIASQDATGMGSWAGKRIIEKIRESKKLNFEKGKTAKHGEYMARIIRLPVSISSPMTKTA